MALDFYLEIEAKPAAEFSIAATGRDAERCSRIENNLILENYQETLAENGRSIDAACDSNDERAFRLAWVAAHRRPGRLAAIALAVHFGAWLELRRRYLKRPTRWRAIRTMLPPAGWAGSLPPHAKGRAVHVAQGHSAGGMAGHCCSSRRAVGHQQGPRRACPATYSRADAVANIQSVSLLGLAFAQARGDLLRIAMSDRIHQPYRAAICPCFRCLLPLAGGHGILGAALSGAGPAVLVIVGDEQSRASRLPPQFAVQSIGVAGTGTARFADFNQRVQANPLRRSS